MTPCLPPDELGFVGENIFRTLCGQARLVCNKSDRDVTGWDFIVEFPMAGPEVPLDQRQAKSFHVQLKSTAGKNGSRVSAKLSAVERLAKDPHPAVIVAFRLRSDGQPRTGYIIHLIGDQLARILRRLRLAEANRAFDINRAMISFDYPKVGARFDLSPNGLKAAFEAVVGDDPAGYVREKQRQLAELGYEDGVLEGEALICIEGPEHFNIVMLGLAPIQPKQLTLFDRRFGIRIPYRGGPFDSIEELRVELPRLGKCDVIVRGGSFAPAAVFPSEMFVPPAMLNRPWLLVRHPDFTISFREDGLNFQTSDVFGSGGKTLDAWVTLVRALSYLADGAARLSIEPVARDTPLLTFPVEQRLDGPYRDELPALMKFLDGWQRVLEVAGMKSVEPFALEAIWDANAAMMAVDLLHNPAPVTFFEFDGLGGAVQAESVKAIYFNSCTFAGTAVSYSVEVTLQATAQADTRYRSTAFAPLDVRPAVSDLEEYGMEQAHRWGLTVVINPAKLTMLDPNEQRAGTADASTGMADKMSKRTL